LYQLEGEEVRNCNMAIESETTLRESTERRSSGTTIIVIGVTMAAVIIGISVIPTLTSFSSHGYSNVSPSKQALCMSKVLELARQGVIRDVGGYSGGLAECLALRGAGSIYGEAGQAS
jgi:hypothetical protein